MKKSKKGSKSRPAAKRTRVFRAAVLGCILLAAGAATAIARYESHSGEPAPGKQGAAPAARPASPYVTVEVGGKKLRVNALALQQGPLEQEQSQQIADALKDNKSTEGLVEVKHAGGTVSVDLQDRFQNVTLAKKNDDGSVSTACVDNPEAATAFLQGREAPSGSRPQPTRKAALQQ